MKFHRKYEKKIDFISQNLISYFIEEFQRYTDALELIEKDYAIHTNKRSEIKL